MKRNNAKKLTKYQTAATARALKHKGMSIGRGMGKAPTRNPNKPVLKFTVSDTSYEVLVAGPDDHIRCTYTSKERYWTPNSVVVRRTGPSGFQETELHTYDASFWGWIGRLMSDRTIDVQLHSLTDEQLDDHEDLRRHDALGLND